MMKKQLIVKFGSNSVQNEEMIRDHVAKLIRFCDEYTIIIVSSGAVAAGMSRLHELGHSRDTISRPVRAALGTALITRYWESAFAAHNVLAAQVLVTHADLDKQLEHSQLLDALQNMRQSGIVAVVNANDLLENDELAQLSYGGDNDLLAQHIARTTKADTLMLLTGADGFMVDGEIMRTIATKDVEGLLRHCYETDKVGTGGMASKLSAAALATKSGIVTHIGSAQADYQEILSGQIGTRVIQ